MAPEKAIKLTVNDLIRTRMADPETGRIKLGWEIVAGGMAGGCQVVSLSSLSVRPPQLRQNSRSSPTHWRLCTYPRSAFAGSPKNFLQQDSSPNARGASRGDEAWCCAYH